jgi:hypothetical protein
VANSLLLARFSSYSKLDTEQQVGNLNSVPLHPAKANLAADCDAEAITPVTSCHNDNHLNPPNTLTLPPPLNFFTMGNLCGKESSPDPFAQPGRTLSSAPPASNTKTSSVPRKVGGPPRTLGSNPSTTNPQSSTQQEDARRKAAEAAEVGT